MYNIQRAIRRIILYVYTIAWVVGYIDYSKRLTIAVCFCLTTWLFYGRNEGCISKVAQVYSLKTFNIFDLRLSQELPNMAARRYVHRERIRFQYLYCQ